MHGFDSHYLKSCVGSEKIDKIVLIRSSYNKCKLRQEEEDFKESFEVLKSNFF